MRKTLAALAAFGCASALSMGIAAAEPPPKQTICHGTASESNPYVIITVSVRSFKDGHFDDGVDKSHGKNNNPDAVYVGGDCVCQGPGPEETPL